MDQRCHRLPELDALRGIAAVAVLFWHYAAHFHARPLSGVLAAFYNTGVYAVDFFFVLSGFVLARRYLIGDAPAALSTNIVKRVARMYPLHLLTLLVVAIGQGILVRDHSFFIFQHNDWYHFVLNVVLAQQLGIQRGLSFNGPSWSISTEFYVNVLFFLVIYLFTRPGPLFACCTIGSALLLAATGSGRIVRDDFVLIADSSVFRTMLGFFSGVLLSQLAPPASFPRPRAFIFASPVLRAAQRVPPYVYDLLFLLTGAWLIPLLVAHPISAQASDFILVIVCFPLLIWSAFSSTLCKSILRSKPFVELGHISYSIYLIHFPLQLVFHMVEAAWRVDIRYASAYILLMFVLTTIAVSSVTYRWVEIPLQDGVNKQWARWHSRA